MRHNFRVLATLALVLLDACASGPQQKSAQELALDRYNAYAGPPIQSFWWPGHFDSWEPLGKDHLVVFTTPFDAYLLKVWPPCASFSTPSGSPRPPVPFTRTWIRSP